MLKIIKKFILIPAKKLPIRC